MRTALSFAVFLVSLLLALPAAATDHPAKILGEQELAAVFRKIVLAHTSFSPENLEIANFTSKPASLAIPPGAMRYRLINQVEGEHLGRKTLRVAILVAGKEYGPITMWADLRLFRKVACAARALARAHLLSDADIDTVRRDITFLGPGVVTDPAAAIGKKLKISVGPGKVLYTRYLEEPPLVKRGDLVTILARSDRIEVKAPGQARNAGAEGDLIRVKNLMSRQIIRAKVEKPGVVEVDF
jgi:flagella basal body P-ring formation protein FlgA